MTLFTKRTGKALVGIAVISLAMILTACEAVPPGRYDVIPADGQIITPGATYEAQGRVFVFRAPLASSTPSQNPTPAPTYTPIPPYPTPSPEECVAVNRTGTSINIRPSWTTAQARIGVMPLGARYLVGHIYAIDNSNRWAYVTWGEGETGWIALEYRGVPIASLSGDCGTVPQGTPRVDAIPEDGPHILVKANSGAILPYANSFSTLKCLNGTEEICLAAKAANPALVTVYRTLNTTDGMRDCPNLVEWDNPDIWYARIRPFWPAGFDYYEVINECGMPGDDYAKMARFHIRMAALAAQDGKAILAFSFAAGNPEVTDWLALYDYVAWATDNPLPDGRYHGLAWHNAMYMPASVPLLSGKWLSNPWVAGRDIMIETLLQKALGKGFTQFPGPVYITEWGADDGYSGDWADSGRYTCEQIAAGYAHTLDMWDRYHPWITGGHFWNIGGQGTKWTNRTNCLALLAEAA